MTKQEPLSERPTSPLPEEDDQEMTAELAVELDVDQPSRGTPSGKSSSSTSNWCVPCEKKVLEGKERHAQLVSEVNKNLVCR